eukprot:gene19104-22879_t
MLADHANSVFASLAADTAAVTTRLTRLSSRLGPLMAQVPQIESLHQRAGIDNLNARPRAEYHADNPERHQMFTTASLPSSVAAVYDTQCTSPPKLHLLDPYMDNGAKALKLYTNPDFFIDEWVAEQAKLREENRARRRERKEARLKKKSEKGETPEVKKVKRLHKVRYDPVTGEKILIPIDSPSTPAPSTPVGYHSPQTTSAHMPPPPPTNVSYPPPPTATANYPPPPTATGGGQRQSVHPAQQQQAHNLPPPPTFMSTPPPSVPQMRPPSTQYPQQPPQNHMPQVPMSRPN